MQRRAANSRKDGLRRILFTSAAVFGGLGALVHAQAPPNPSQGQLAAPYGADPAGNNNNVWGIANTSSGGTAAGQFNSTFAPSVIAERAPGANVIRLNR